MVINYSEFFFRHLQIFARHPPKWYIVATALCTANILSIFGMTVDALVVGLTISTFANLEYLSITTSNFFPMANRPQKSRWTIWTMVYWFALFRFDHCFTLSSSLIALKRFTISLSHLSFSIAFLPPETLSASVGNNFLHGHCFR